MSDEETQENRTEELPPPPPQPETPTRPRRLLRSSQDRVLGGVCGGLAAYFGVDSIIFRIGFALSIFFGGLGILAYILLAIFVAPDDDPERGAGIRLRGGGGFWRVAGLVVLGLIAIALLFGLAGSAAFAVALGWGLPVAVVVIAVGGLLVLAAFRGGARWLVPPAIAIALGASVAAASDVDFSGGVGERAYRPLDEASIPADGYRLGVGELTIDLRELEWEPGEVVELETSMGAGLTAIYVPETVCVTGTTHMGGGSQIVAGERNEGLGLDEEFQAGSEATPRLELDTDQDFGELWVINDDTIPAASGPSWHRDLGEAGLRAAQERACETG